VESWVPDFVQKRIERIGAISRFLAEQCNAPWTAIGDVLPGAAKDPVISLVTFGLDDVLRGYFRPKGLKGPRKFRRRQRWYNRPTIPEIGEEIGKRLPYVEEVKGRSFGTAEKFLWIADGAMQRALYYVMIFDVVLDTWYNSVIALQKMGYCSTPTPPKASRGPWNFRLLFPGGPWVVDPPPPQGYSYAGTRRKCRLFASATFTNPNSMPVTFSWQHQWLNDPGDVVTIVKTITVPALGVGTSIIDLVHDATSIGHPSMNSFPNPMDPPPSQYTCTCYGALMPL
jgi:hypothetical protein